MSFFTALKDSEFSRAAFAAAGLDFDAAIKANEVSVLKTAIDAAKPTADQLNAASVIEAARSENSALVSGIEAAGLSAAKPDTLKAQIASKIEAAVPKAAREIVARAGHPGVDEPIAADASNSAKAASNMKTHAEFSKMSAGEKMRFCKSGGKITHLPVDL